MGSVNGVPDYIDTVGIGADGVVTNTTKQGGIVAIYYFGAMFGCFIGGRFGDKYGRKKAVIIGSILALIGGSIQAASVSAAMSLVARVIVGLGVGFINAVCHRPRCNADIRLSPPGCQNLPKHTTEAKHSPLSFVPITLASSLPIGWDTACERRRPLFDGGSPWHSRSSRSSSYFAQCGSCLNPLDGSWLKVEERKRSRFSPRFGAMYL